MLDSIIKIRPKPHLASPLGEKKKATNSDVNIDPAQNKTDNRGNRK